MWFTIKCKPACRDGANHIFLTIAKSRYLTEELWGIIDAVVQHKGYVGHPENMLLNMIGSNP